MKLPRYRDEKTELRFWSKVNKNGPIPWHVPDLGPCWIWLAAKSEKGYGIFYFMRDKKLSVGKAHRYSFEANVGPIPAGMCALHHCNNSSCIRPSHLFLGTRLDNNEDMKRKGRRSNFRRNRDGFRRGSKHPQAKLNEKLVQKLRHDRKAGHSYSALSREYGVSISTAWQIANEKSWVHV